MIGDTKPITCRPADLLEDELPALRKAIELWMEQEEDVLTYALFPQAAIEFFKFRQAQKTKIDPTIAQTDFGVYPI